jgi:hypothetical protein
VDTASVVLLYGAIAAAFTAIAATVSPLLLSRMTAKQLRASKLEDYARQDAVAAQAAEAARLLLAANDKVARVAEATAANVDAKLTVIHTLVNSTLTEAKAEQLRAVELHGLALREIVELHKAAGQTQAATRTQAAVDANEAQAAALRAELVDRDTQTAVADKQAPD